MKRQLFWLLALLPVLIPVSSVNSQLPSSPPPVLAACYNAATSSWITMSALASGPALLSQPPSLVGMYGKNSNGSFYPVACDTNGNISSTANYVPPVPANWSTLGTGCTSGTITTTGGLTAISMTGTGGGTNTCGVSIPMSGSFSKVFVINTAVSNSNFSGILVGFTDGTKYEACGTSYNSGSSNTWISSLTLSGTVSAGIGVVNSFGVLQNPQYYRLSSTGTNLKCEYSIDQGLNWIVVGNDTTPFLTTSALFFGFNARSGSPSFGYLVSYQ